MDRKTDLGGGWQEVVAPLASLMDLDATARTKGALLRRREIESASSLLRLAMAWGPGGLSLRRAAAWAGLSGIADLCDGAVPKRLRKAADRLEWLVQTVLPARAPAAESFAAQGRSIRLVDGSTFGAAGSDKPGWRLQAGFDLPTGRMGTMTPTPIAEGGGLERVPATPGRKGSATWSKTAVTSWFGRARGP